MDGAITHHQFMPSNQAGGSKLIITGEDISVMMDLEEKIVAYPALPEAAIATKESILQQLPQLVTQGILDQTTADLRTYGVQTEIAQLTQQLAQLPPVNLKELSQAVSIPQFWEDLSEPERRFFFREFIREIQVIRHDSTWALKLVFTF